MSKMVYYCCTPFLSVHNLELESNAHILVFMISKKLAVKLMADSIRSAQAIELLRTTYFKSKISATTISPISDLDYLLVEKRCRPSIFLGVFESGGFILG